MYKTILSLVLGLVLAVPAFAIQVFQPPWVVNPNDPKWAGGSTTSEAWEFWGNPLGTTHPERWNNPFGPPTDFQPVGATPAFDPNGPGLTGVNTWLVGLEGGGFSLTVPDDPIPRPLKVIHLQYTSDKSSSNAPGTIPPGSASAGGVAGHPPSAYYTYEWLLYIQPNPPSETINVSFPAGTHIGEVEVATICVPEPSTLVLLGIGAASLLAYAWRRRERAA